MGGEDSMAGMDMDTDMDMGSQQYPPHDDPYQYQSTDHPPSPMFGKKSDIGKTFVRGSSKRFTTSRNQSQISLT
jgi:hypothetical protein